VLDDSLLNENSWSKFGAGKRVSTKRIQDVYVCTIVLRKLYFSLFDCIVLLSNVLPETYNFLSLFFSSLIEKYHVITKQWL